MFAIEFFRAGLAMPMCHENVEPKNGDIVSAQRMSGIILIRVLLIRNSSLSLLTTHDPMNMSRQPLAETGFSTPFKRKSYFFMPTYHGQIR
jgi:hypothetical protein